MLYFSEIKGKKVISEDHVLVGYLDDLIFQASEFPQLTKLIIRLPNSQKIIIDIDALIKIKHDIIIKKKYNLSKLSENELYLVKNLLDKQIIDIKGHKVIRVNDVVIQYKESWYISGVDVGVLGLLRWIKLEKFFKNLYELFGWKMKSIFLSWADIQPLELARGQVFLKKKEEKLQKIRSEDLADYLEKTTIRNVKKVIDTLNTQYSAEVLQNLNINYQSAIFRSFPPEKAAQFLEVIDSDEVVDILLAVGYKKRQLIIPFLSESKKQEVIYLLDLSKTSIGKLITSEYFYVDSQMTVFQILNRIKTETTDFSSLNYIYVINQEKQLIGVINLHELLLQSNDVVVFKFMTQNVIVVHLTTPEEIAVKKMLKYHLVALPVIDVNKKILGIITLDDVGDFILKQWI